MSLLNKRNRVRKWLRSRFDKWTSKATNNGNSFYTRSECEKMAEFYKKLLIAIDDLKK